ncbi:nuclear transport factor 2 family protein [Streptomyces sp. NPDC021080]|uniref:nuclear transport factor 2 family protein n=1 Tax=Streptomyces sp. NPDC021080 TaxID=3365110 RepID=UPI00378F02C7
MQVWELTARELVRDTIARYTHAGDRFRLEELAACFTDDGVLEIKGRDPVRGRPAIVELLGGGSSGSPRTAVPGFFVRHFVANVAFDQVTPDRIDASSYFLVVTDQGPDHWGRYRDVLRPVGDRWLLEHRLVAVDAVREGGWYAKRRP